ncbi:unnamed protein product [Caenorhabditis nigoni]
MSDVLNTSTIFDVFGNNVMGDTFSFGDTYLIIMFVILFLLQLLFPFYAYVNRVNRERDKNTLVFPLIDHFYKMMKKTHAICIFMCLTLLFIRVRCRSCEERPDTTNTSIPAV